MTVTYVQHIPNSGCWGFYRVLAKWRGSLYKVAFKQISKDLNILLLLWKGYLEKRCVLLPALRGNKRFVQAAKIFPYFFVKII